MNTERFSFEKNRGMSLRKKMILGVGTLGVAWSASIGFTAYKYVETRSEVNHTPILRTHDELSQAHNDLIHEDSAIICFPKGGCVIEPEHNPNRGDAVSNLDEAQVNSPYYFQEQIAGVKDDLLSKNNSDDANYFRDDRQHINEIMAQIESDTSFVNIRAERDAYKTALTVLSTVGGFGVIIGGTIGAFEIFDRRRFQ